MNVKPLAIPDVLLLEPKVVGDDRGFFLEYYNQRVFESLGIAPTFVQDNHSHSRRNVLRGLHYQVRAPQGKLIRAVSGAIWDVAVDIRKNSPTFGRWVAEELSAENKKMLWIPEGFAHGFVVVSEFADMIYKVTEFYLPADERSILWNDPQLGIPWPLIGEPTLSTKDRAGTPFRQAEFSN
jgi:dTDP-4-dehydrorhamnose 3,5-epimerase